MAPSNSSSVSQPNGGPTFGDALAIVQSPVQEEPEIAKKSLHGQALWEKSMTDIDLTRSYRKVSVMIVHWEKEDHVDLEAAQDEIDRLRHVFESRYNYSVRETVLGHDERGRSAQAQLQKHLADFVFDEDEAQTLLIVYGAGHGIPVHETGKFLLTSDNPAVEGASDRFNSIVWQEAEAIMRPVARADVFLILDCCHAGRLLNMRAKGHWSERIFEFLGACSSNQTTPLPGRESFTSALIWALENLADADRPFFSSELRDKIGQYEHLNKEQLPCLSPRGIQSLRKLILEPLPNTIDEKEGKEKSLPKADAQKTGEAGDLKYALKLYFLLPNIPSDDEIRKLCDSVKYLITTREISAKQVLWKGLFDMEGQSPELARVVDTLATKWYNMTLKTKIKKMSQSAIDTSNLAQFGSQLILTNGLLTPAPTEIIFDGGEDSNHNTTQQSAKPAVIIVPPQPARGPSPDPPKRPLVMRFVFFAFLLFLTGAMCYCMVLLFNVRNLIMKILLLGRSLSKKQSSSRVRMAV